MYEPASLGMFQCRLQRILCDFEVIMFFRKDPPQTEGRRDADPLMPNQNVAGRRVRAGPEGGAARPADGHVDVMLGGVLFGFMILSSCYSARNNLTARLINVRNCSSSTIVS